MFSLIITVIAVALVTALALATIYYGGTAFRQGRLAARAATLVNQGQQILAAYDLYETNQGKPPSTLGDLTPLYLREIPLTAMATSPMDTNSNGWAPAAYAQTAEPAASLGPWQLPIPQVATITIQIGVPLDLCQAINLKARGDNGVLVKAYANTVTQCFGPDASALTIVVTRDGGSLVQALGATAVSAGTPPLASDTVSLAWLVPPDTATAQAPSTALTDPSPDIVATPQRLNFGAVAVDGNSFGELTLLVTNKGSGTAQRSNFAMLSSLPDAWGNNFGVDWGGCPASIEPQQSCTLVLQYWPDSTPGIQSDTLTYQGHRVAELTGSGSADLSSPSLTFDYMSYFAASATQYSAPRPIVVFLYNWTDTDVPVTWTVTGSGFELSSSACPTVVAAYASCRITIKVLADQVGVATGTLTSGTAQTISLTSDIRPVPPPPPPLTFTLMGPRLGTFQVGDTSAVGTINVANISGLPVALDWTTTGNFSFASSTCDPSIPAGSACLVYVHLDNGALGQNTGTLLAGNGQSFALSAELTPSTISGLTLDYTIPASYPVSPVYVASQDSLVFVARKADTSFEVQKFAFATQQISSWAPFYPGSYAIDPADGSVFTTTLNPSIYRFDVQSQAYVEFSTQAQDCALISVLGSKVFMDCGGKVRSLDKATGLTLLPYEIAPSNMAWWPGLIASTDSLVGWSYGSTVLAMYDGTTGVTSTVDMTMLANRPFLTQSHRIFFQTADQSIYQLVDGTPFKVVLGTSLQAAGCQYYNGVVSTIFERNGKVELVCQYSPWQNGSSAAGGQVMSFTPAR